MFEVVVDFVLECDHRLLPKRKAPDMGIAGWPPKTHAEVPAALRRRFAENADCEAGGGSAATWIGRMTGSFHGSALAPGPDAAR
jgi:hypothetical protein